ncbi:MAG: NAD(P)/FAD-dependent oxidoreductase, partial [Chloroflexota bacterium]|nr:NAD(P)/FAD-dependent oxidoreductase [Chloroflexota bacterium]
GEVGGGGAGVVGGGGRGGGTAARIVAEAGLRVLLVEKRPVVGLPVQCAEYVPVQIVGYVTLPEHCIAQRIRTLRTHLPDGELAETPAAGYVLDRASFDKSLAVAAGQAGAEVWTAARAVERAERGVLVQQGNRTVEVECRVVIGADGPRSTVGSWIGQTNDEFIDGLQVEAVLPTPQDFTEVYFDPAYQGGYGWLFPKGETANVGVGVNRKMGGDPRQALDHLLARLEIAPGKIVGRTGGPVPSNGPVARLHVGNTLLVGDAAGHTHPVTGAGIFAAVVSGTLAGNAAARAIESDDLAALSDYEREWTAFMGGPLRHALTKRRYLDEHWSDDVVALSDIVREGWIAFKAYGRHKGH